MIDRVAKPLWGVGVTVPVLAAALVPWWLLPVAYRVGLLAGAALMVIVVARRSLPLAFYQAVLWMALVRVEPAPVDAVWPVLALYTLLDRPSRAEVFSWAGTRSQWVHRWVGAGLMCVFGLTGFLTLPAAADTPRALFFQGVTLYLAMAGAWFSLSLASQRLRRAAMTGWLVSAVMIGVIGLLSLAVRSPYCQEYLYWSQRVEGTFKDPNVFGSYMAFGVLLTLIEVWLSSVGAPPEAGLVSARWTGPILCLLVMAAVASLSRGTWLGLAVGLVAVATFWLRTRRKRRLVLRAGLIWLVMAPVLAIGFEFAVGLLPLTVERVGIQPYDAVRWEKQAEGLALVTGNREGQNQVSALGPGNYESRLHYAAHNVYIRLFAETGLVSLILFAMIAALALRQSLIRASRFPDAFELAVVGYLVFALVYGAFIDILHWRHLWLVLGGAAVPIRGPTRQADMAASPGSDSASR